MFVCLVQDPKYTVKYPDNMSPESSRRRPERDLHDTFYCLVERLKR